MSSGVASTSLLPAGRGMRLQDLVFPVGIVASVLVILVPLPAALMDLLLSANVAIAVIMLLTTIYVRTPLEFSIFPSLLLATTLFRLVLNVATTRLILTRAAADGLLAAGGVVKTFGEFVTGGSTGTDKIVVGLIIFAIIVIIQFVVITKGATRISEVAARFALDGMPGRQMAIDADLNAGIIDEREAQRRRKEISQQADFFGAMDGASKFVRGDAIAGIIITLINIVGGLFIGMIESGMSLGQAASLFTTLTIGDGLVSQVPAFLISLAAGLLVTRSSSESDLPREFVQQLFSRPQALAVAGGFLSILIFTSLPRIPLLAIGATCIGLALSMTRRGAAAQAASEAKKQAEAAKPAETRVEDYLSVDPMEVEIGVGLIRLADPRRGGDLLERIQRVRQNVAGEIGIILPKVRIRDNMRLDQNQYRIKIADMPVAEGPVYAAKFLAMDSGTGTSRRAVARQGMATREPAFGTPAVWIEPAVRDQAEMYGYTVVEPGSVIATHLTETIRRHADEILTRDSTKHLIDELKRTSPVVVDELIPGVMKLSRSAADLADALARGRADPPAWPDPGDAGRLRPADQGADPADGIRAASPGPLDLHAASQRREPLVRGHARSGPGGPHSGRLRAQRARAVRPHVAAGRRGHLPADCRGHREADTGQPSARGAGESADPRRLAADDRLAPAEPGGAELQRNHAGYEDRGDGDGVGREIILECGDLSPLSPAINDRLAGKKVCVGPKW